MVIGKSLNNSMEEELKFHLSDEMKDMFAEIIAMQQGQQRQAVTMLAGFISTKETDLDYMDSYMDPLFDFIEQESDTEKIIREYISYIATFNPHNAQSRLADLEETLGYKAKIVYAAGLVAKQIHAGQKDKGDNDYFTSHLLPVGLSGFDWKEKVVGFLHDAAEDTPYSVPEIIEKLNRKVEDIVNAPEEEWYEPWMENIMPFPGESTHNLTPEETKEIVEALNLLNHNTTSSRENYINRMRGNMLAIKVKLNDLKNNMDISRIPAPTEKDEKRISRYHKEFQCLQEMLDEIRHSISIPTQSYDTRTED